MNRSSTMKNEIFHDEIGLWEDIKLFNKAKEFTQSHPQDVTSDDYPGIPTKLWKWSTDRNDF